MPRPPIIIVCERPSQGRMPSRLPDGSQVVLTSAVCHSPLVFAILFLVQRRDIRQIHSHTSDVLFNQVKPSSTTTTIAAIKTRY
ncbi:hypothetical protein CDAR_36111 [Caerostris darwini]|uniref:Uncharacterized protein n=1 Tax=Caerostris darwini TaxID=1538125 RepID=A0AAV4VDZ5_9ARAC|nr:hypothetical protein CDAR_36111 [Caerostris darwini]